MTGAPRLLRTHTDSDIEAMLIELNEAGVDRQRLRAWVSASGIPVKRVVATPGLTYIRLAGNDSTGGYIVLMLLDGLWQRVI
jgi:arsenate reductase-like glutaredoxin family protein